MYINTHKHELHTLFDEPMNLVHTQFDEPHESLSRQNQI